MPTHDDWERLESEGSTLYKEWIEHFSQKQPGPELLLTDTLKQRFPNHTITSTNANIDILGFPGVSVVPLREFEPPLVSLEFHPPPRRAQGSGNISQVIKFAALNLGWQGESFIVVMANWREGFNNIRQTNVLHDGPKAEQTIETFLTAVWAYQDQLHDEILLFNNGFWVKDKDLWKETQKANWDDVILDEPLKSQIRNDVDNFFKSEEVYRSLSVPWKRGIILLGPPGNGKTISIKAIMKTTQVPSLYVKSFSSYDGPEAAIRRVFQKARYMAPCLLILEDLDSLIDDRIRSYFLNELDGLEGNDGILLIGSTNHFDRLDPGLANRPSRFDRKFLFDNPSLSERVMYAQYWRKNLAANKSIDFPKSLVDHVASTTEGFSFAYLKEAFVSSLVSIATGTESAPFATVIEKRIKQLRQEIERKDRVQVKQSSASASGSITPPTPSRWFSPADI